MAGDVLNSVLSGSDKVKSGGLGCLWAIWVIRVIIGIISGIILGLDSDNISRCR